MNIKELADSTSGPVRAALLALEAKVMMLEHDLAESVEQHEEFKQEVSDALVIYSPENRNPALGRFIIPKPDPLVEVAESLGYFNTAAQGWAGDVRAALKARGLEIREKANDD